MTEEITPLSEKRNVNQLNEEKNVLEKPYPRGHCWEGLTPRQVNEAYAKLDKEKENSQNE